MFCAQCTRYRYGASVLRRCSFNYFPLRKYECANRDSVLGTLVELGRERSADEGEWPIARHVCVAHSNVCCECGKAKAYALSECSRCKGLLCAASECRLQRSHCRQCATLTEKQRVVAYIGAVVRSLQLSSIIDAHIVALIARSSVGVGFACCNRAMRCANAICWRTRPLISCVIERITATAKSIFTAPSS